MEIKQVNTIIAITVVIICVAAILVPVVNDAQETAGDQVTLTNDSSIVLREAESGDVLKCVRTIVTAGSAWSDVWTLNDEEITTLASSSVTWNVGMVSDGAYLNIFNSANSSAGMIYDMDNVATTYYLGADSSAEAGTTATATFEFGDSEITYTDRTGTEYTFDYTWAYVICPYSDGEYCAAVSGGTGIVDSASDVILCGAYTSGELDTMYYYKDGTSYVSNTDYTMTPEITTALHSGTTDIYDATVSVSMTDGTDTESFTPYRIIVPYEVTGHATSGGYYSLLGAIPVMVIVGLLVTTIGMMVIRRND